MFRFRTLSSVIGALAATAPAMAGNNQWTGGGPQDNGGSYRVIHALASDGTTIYAGSGSGLVFAYDALSPGATTNAASSITASGATLNGTINANGADAAASFEYGATASYGNTVTATPATVTGNTDTAVSAAISGLTCGATYHFRVRADNASGNTTGGDASFTTVCQGQAITGFAASPNGGRVGDSSTLSVTGSGASGNPVVFGTGTPGICSVSGNVVSYLAAGTCTITADQAGNGLYSAAPQATLGLAVTAAATVDAAAPVPTLTEAMLAALSVLLVLLTLRFGHKAGRNSRRG